MKSIISMRSLCVAAVAAISASNLFLASCNGEDDYEMNGEYTLAEGRMTRGNDAGIGSGGGLGSQMDDGYYTAVVTFDFKFKYNDSVVYSSAVQCEVTIDSFCSLKEHQELHMDRNLSHFDVSSCKEREGLCRFDATAYYDSLGLGSKSVAYIWCPTK